MHSETFGAGGSCHRSIINSESIDMMALSTTPLVSRDVGQIFFDKTVSRPSCDRTIVSILKRRANTKTSTTQTQKIHSLRCSSGRKHRLTKASAGVQDSETVSSEKLEETEVELQTRLDEEDIADIMQVRLQWYRLRNNRLNPAQDSSRNTRCTGSNDRQHVTISTLLESHTDSLHLDVRSLRRFEDMLTSEQMTGPDFSAS